MTEDCKACGRSFPTMSLLYEHVEAAGHDQDFSGGASYEEWEQRQHDAWLTENYRSDMGLSE